MGNQGIDGMIIIKLNLMKQDGTAWTDVIWLRRGTTGRVLL
jgi:hypothetical protein